MHYQNTFVSVDVFYLHTRQLFVKLPISARHGQGLAVSGEQNRPGPALKELTDLNQQSHACQSKKALETVNGKWLVP